MLQATLTIRHRAMLLGGVAASIMYAPGADAQAPAVPSAQGTVPQSGDSAAPGEIIVTAQKRSERLNDVPISITAVTGNALVKQGILSTADLAKVVPGFTYQRSTFGTPVFTIRGIGLYDTSVGIAPTVSVYVDQIPLPYLAMTPGASLDVERVEVLKGPQGMLFGQNSTGGAINYIAAKPTADPHMGFDLSYGRFNEVDAQGFVSGPITDTLRVRVAGSHQYQDGWQYSETRPGDRNGARDFSDARVLLDWEASSRLKLELNVNGWRDRSESQAAQFLAFIPSLPAPLGYPEATIALGNRAPAGNKAREADWDPNFNLRANSWQYQTALRSDYQVNDAVTLTSLTSYAKLRVLNPTDPDGTDFEDIRVTKDAHIRTFSQELRGAVNLPWVKLTVGGNYENDHTLEIDRFGIDGSNSGVGPNRFHSFNNIVDQHVKTYAVFSSADVPITRTLTAQVGARYTKQDRAFAGCIADSGDGGEAAAIALIPTFAGLPFDPAPNGQCVTLNTDLQRVGLVRSSLNQHNVSWRAGLNWKPTARTLIYGNVTRGFKAGAYTPLPAIFATQLQPVTQEEVTAYEIGLKSQFFNRMLDVSTAAFYYDYRNKQIQGTVAVPIFGALPQLVNIPKSSVLGAEIEATLHPARGLSFTGGAIYVKSRVDDHTIRPDPLENEVDLKGETFPNTPRWQLNGSADYEVPVSSDLKLVAGGNISYRSSSNAAFGENPAFRFKPYSLVDVRAGVATKDDKIRVELFGHNIFNTFYWTNVSYFVDTIARTTGMPATYGIRLSSRF
jgi:outer membrane receptor protein involved in Fe transport